MKQFKKFLFELLPLRNYIDGFILENDVSDLNNAIKIGDGVASVSTNDDIVRRSASIVKRLDAAWIQGAGGGLDTGTKAINTTYHVFIIRKDDGTTDGLFSLSPTAPTLPSGYTAFRRVGSVVTDGSNNIRNFIQRGNVFNLKVPYLSVQILGTGGYQNLNVGCPAGVEVEVFGQLGNQANGDGGRSAVTVTDPVVDNPAASMTIGSGHSIWGFGGGRVAGFDSGSYKHFGTMVYLTTNNGQLRFRSDSSSAYTTFFIVGWRDFRGRQ